MNKKIIIFANYFCAWDGGIDLLKHWLTCITRSSKKKKIDVLLVLPKSNFTSFLKLILHPFLFFLKKFIFENKFIFKKWPYWHGAKEIENYVLNDLKNSFNIIYSDYSQKNKVLKKYRGNIFFPSIEEILTENSIGYVFDFQHEYFKDFFSKNEIFIRRNKINKLSILKKIIVNSKKTKEDLLKFHKNFKENQIYVIPFAPSDTELKFEKKMNREGFFKNEFFIVCNKFWKHKNHKVVLEAFRVYKKKGGRKNLIFTGDKNDYKSKDVLHKIEKYILRHNLSEFIKITGRISKRDQLNLMFNSKALIQPTLFEGGPGGGSVYDAISMGKNIIISNIDINKEIKYDKLLFFDPNNYNSLYKILDNFEIRVSKSKFKNNFKEKTNLRKKCGNFLIKTFSTK